VNIDALFLYVLPNVVGCPRLTMQHHIRLAAIEFCEQSRLHEEECATVNTGLGVVNVTPGSDLEIVAISSVYVGEREYHSKTRRSGLGLLNANCSDGFYTVSAGGKLTINPVQLPDVPVRVVASLRPAMNATTLSDELMEWREAIASGAVQRIAALPNETFTSPELSIYHKSIFDSAVKVAKVQRYLATGETSVQRRVSVF
jgi:hypothetical protein